MPVTRCRMMRAVVTTITELNISWKADYEACFLEVKPPHLKGANLDFHHEGALSVHGWEAIPKLENLNLYGRMNPAVDRAGIRPVISALERGVAFQHLRQLDLRRFDLARAEWDRLFGALAGAGCAAQLTSLKLERCTLCPASMATLSSLVGEDRLPMLTTIGFDRDALLKDGGVVALAQGLLATHLLVSSSWFSCFLRLLY